MTRIIAILACLISSVSFADPVSINLQDVRLSDLARVVYGDLLHKSYIFDSDFSHTDEDVSVNWRKLSKAQVENLTAGIFKERGFSIEKVHKVLHFKRQESPKAGLLVYKPLYRSVGYLGDVIQSVTGISQLGTRKLPAPPSVQADLQKIPDTPGAASALIDRSAPDQLAYSCDPVECGRVRSLLEQLDTPEAQIVLHAALYEVGTQKGDGSALQLVIRLLGGKAVLSTGAAIAGGDQLHVLGDLDTVLSALDTDSHFKELSRPMVRVKTGAQAKFSVGQQVPVLGAITVSGNGVSQQSVQYMQSGTIFTVQPDVHEDVVDLNITQELSSFISTTTGVNNSPTLLQRTANSELVVKPGQVVVFAGLEESTDSDARSRFLGFQTSKQSSISTTQVLLFIQADRI